MGTFLTRESKFDNELRRRLSRANGAYYASWELLGCTRIPLEKRLQVFRPVVDTAVFWCAGSWNFMREQNEHLRTTHIRLIRKMLRLKREDGEEMGTFLRRANGILRD